MDRQYYQDYYLLERSHWWFAGRRRILERLIRTREALRGGGRLRILNVGCATGHSSEWLSGFGEVTSIEYDPECARMAAEITGLNVEVGSVKELAFPDGQFDLVTAFDVLEHVDDDRLAASELVRVCKPGGVVLVTVPAFQFLWSEHDEVNHHFRRYHRAGLSALFEPVQRPGSRLEAGYFNCLLFPLVLLAKLAESLAAALASARRDAPPKSNFAKYNTGVAAGLLEAVFASEARLVADHSVRLPFGSSLFLSMTC